MQIASKLEYGPTQEINVPAGELEQELRGALRGEIRFDDGTRALYATAGGNYRQVPIGVVIPKTEEDIVECIRICRAYGAPVLPRGGGTSLAGQGCNVAVVIDVSKYLRRILELDPERKVARVQPGLVLDELRDAALKHHLTFAPDPATHNHCTLGGMIGNNSCGVHSVMGGKTEENIEELRIITYDGLQLRVGKTSDQELDEIIAGGGRRGEIYSQLRTLRDKYADSIRNRYPKIPRRVSGYNLDELLPENGFHVARALVGSEGTCVTVLDATCRLVYSPPKSTLLVLGYPNVYTAGDHIMDVMAHHPIALEGIDDGLVNDMKKKGMHPEDIRLLPNGGGWLLVEFGGESKEESDGRAQALAEALRKQTNPPSMKLFDDEKQEKMVWKIRESGLGATAMLPNEPPTWEGWEDSAVPPEKLGNYLRDLRKLLDKYAYRGDLYGHFGQGCVHTRIDFDLETHKGIEKYRSFVHEAAELVANYGGSLSGEHGDGQSRAELLPIMFGDELVDAFREFKRIWDPAWKMNPGKVVYPYRVDENLRLGANYRPWVPDTHFQFPEDSGNFARAALRCVGVGECRRENSGTMCPSYMVTHEEEHSTRGRARLLFEMLQRQVIRDGWHDEAVHDALDLCLSCKGCKGDCPVNVDMATYKAEFLSHYYQGRLRPRSAYSIGLIHVWSQIAGRYPRLVNFFTQTPGLRALFKVAGGFAPERRIPRYATQTFKDWFFQRQRRAHKRLRVMGRRKPVILWADTFNNYFHPSVAQAAVEILEAAGCDVSVPHQNLCCGRPLYDYGILTSAKRRLEQTLAVLRAEIRSGIPVVVLEPSCAAVFRDELRNMYPGDEDAKRLAQQTFLLSEFLDKHAPGYEIPTLERKATVHIHCHHRAVMKTDSEENILDKLGIDYKVLDSGCCGMAGGFGFEKEHYAVSVKAGERVLLPAVRSASRDTLIIADGFSCREQISQMTNRQALHLAEVLQMASHASRKRIEDEWLLEIQPRKKTPALAKFALFAGGLLVGGSLIWAVKKR